MAASRLAIQTHFRNIKDPRRCPRHLLLDIITIAICAVICGANDWQQIVTFGQQRRTWLSDGARLDLGDVRVVYAGAVLGLAKGPALLGARLLENLTERLRHEPIVAVRC